MDQELQRIQRASDVTRDRRALLHNYVTASGGRPSWLPSWMYNVVSEIRQSMRTNSKNNPSKFHPDWITRARRRDHITPVLCQLHWLPVRRRVDFKPACLVRQALCGQMPTYLADDVHLVSEGNRRRRSLRSSSDNMCAVPRTHNSFGDRSFGAAGLRIWNSLPRGLRTLDISYKHFKTILKTYMFD